MSNPVNSAPTADGRNPHRMRAVAVLVVVVCLFGTLIGRLWYLQGVEAATPLGLQVANESERTFYIAAQRGDIFDRDGVLLAGNRIEQVVTVSPGAVEAHPGIVAELGAVLGEPVARVQAAIDNNQYSPYQPVPVAEGVSQSIVLAIDENQALLPGVTVQAEPVRYYPYGATTANIIGYVRQITGAEYAKVQTEQCAAGIPCYGPTSGYGQAGVEASFEKYLRGVPGKEVVAVDSQGQVLYRISYTPPVPGDDLVLSISLTDQKAAVAALGDWVTNARKMTDQVSNEPYRAPGAAMSVLDPRNGEVLALATYPDYNPNAFTGVITNAEWAYYNNPKNNFPTIDRPISSGYAPGSTWKLVTATAMLRAGLRTPDTYYDDIGSYTIGGQTFDDNDNQALNWVDLPEALTESSDTYFYSIGGEFYQDYDASGKLTGPDPLQQVASDYGLGHYSGIDLPDEAPGLVPDAQVVAKMHAQYPKDYPDGNWEPGFEVQEAIGEGEDLVTPLQLDNAYAAFGNGGTLYVPQVALAIEAPGRGDRTSGKILKLYYPKVKNLVPMPSSYDRAAILEGLVGVTASTDGTAYGAFQNFPLAEYPVAGKTGTAQVDEYCAAGTTCAPGQVPWPAYKQDTSVFTSFAPADDPRFAVDAVFEQSGYGADVAAPAVEQEYTTLFGLNKPARGGSCPSSSTTTSAAGTAASASATTTTAPACAAGGAAATTTTTAPGVGG
ncbi:MAG TPA: penicillin-binding transpeptidase domain-containing protein [Acidimicrobiales bacterium]|nr:penicillin-binding transpeptidase domain-containing protein [Acidimicrobiales bacterium]